MLSSVEHEKKFKKAKRKICFVSGYISTVLVTKGRITILLKNIVWIKYKTLKQSKNRL